MGTAVELTDVHHIVLVLEHGSLVVVHIEIVGSREDGDERREPGGLAFSVHSVARVLCFVCSDY